MITENEWMDGSDDIDSDMLPNLKINLAAETLHAGLPSPDSGCTCLSLVLCCLAKRLLPLSRDERLGRAAFLASSRYSDSGCCYVAASAPPCLLSRCLYMVGLFICVQLVMPDETF